MPESAFPARVPASPGGNGGNAYGPGAQGGNGGNGGDGECGVASFRAHFSIQHHSPVFALAMYAPLLSCAPARNFPVWPPPPTLQAAVPGALVQRAAMVVTAAMVRWFYLSSAAQLTPLSVPSRCQPLLCFPSLMTEVLLLHHQPFIPCRWQRLGSRRNRRQRRQWRRRWRCGLLLQLLPRRPPSGLLNWRQRRQWWLRWVAVFVWVVSARA